MIDYKEAVAETLYTQMMSIASIHTGYEQMLSCKFSICYLILNNYLISPALPDRVGVSPFILWAVTVTMYLNHFRI